MGLRVLAVDDEAPALRDLVWLLEQAPEVDEVITAGSGADALRLLNERPDIDAVMLDIQMPGLDGVELVKVLRNFRTAPEIAFVTAFEEYALAAFDLDVADYLLKPVDPERLAETLRRFSSRGSTGGTNSSAPGAGGGATSEAAGGLPRLTCRTGDRRHIIDRDDVTIVEASGGYARVYTSTADFLVNETISSLTSAWSGHGFVRIHRSYLVRTSAISEVVSKDGRRTVVVADTELPLSRRYTKLLQDQLGGFR